LAAERRARGDMAEDLKQLRATIQKELTDLKKPGTKAASGISSARPKKPAAR
jgi:hypothetical protein